MQDKPYSSKLNHQPFILRCKPLTVHAARRSIVLPKNEEYMKWSTKQSWQTGETKMKITAWEWVTLRRICSFSCKTPPFCSLDTISLSWKAGRHSSPLYLALSLLSLWVERVCYGEERGYLKALLHTTPWHESRVTVIHRSLLQSAKAKPWLHFFLKKMVDYYNQSKILLLGYSWW